jgi:hypothetical protein
MIDRSETFQRYESAANAPLIFLFVHPGHWIREPPGGHRLEELDQEYQATIETKAPPQPGTNPVIFQAVLGLDHSGVSGCAGCRSRTEYAFYASIG